LTKLLLFQRISAVIKTFSLVALASVAAACSIAAEVSFSKEIAPVLMKKCLACHNAEKKKGGYEMESYEGLLKPGKSKLIPIESGQPEKSELFHRITTTDPDDRMPQKDEPLSPETITLIKDWIAQGAKFDGPNKSALLASLIPTTYPAPPTRYPHAAPVLSLAFNKEGTEMAVGGYHEIMVWSPEKAQLLRRMTNVARRIHAISWSGDEKELWAATGTPGMAGEVVVFEHGSTEPVGRLCRIGDEMLALAFNADGSLLAAGGADNAIHIIDVKARKEKVTINQHADWVTALSFSPDGKHLASASRDRTARVYSSETGVLETTYNGHASAVYAVAFGKDGKDVFSAGKDKSIHIWKAEDGKETGKLNGTVGDVYRLVLYEDSLFCAAADGIVREFSGRDLKRSFKGHADSVFALATSKEILASGCYDGTIKLWNLSSGAEVKTFSAAP
jgi:WD40 repeat protein